MKNSCLIEMSNDETVCMPNKQVLLIANFMYLCNMYYLEI